MPNKEVKCDFIINLIKDFHTQIVRSWVPISSKNYVIVP